MTEAIAFLVVTAGVFGLVIGSFLNVVAHRVPRGISLMRESRCPQCDALVRMRWNVPVVSWLILKGRCARCGAPISPRYPVVELLTGIVFALVALGVSIGRSPDLRPVDGPLWFGTAEFWGTLITLETFAALSIALTLIDLDSRRLPNRIVIPGWVTMGGMLFVTALLTGIEPTNSQALAIGASEPATTSAFPGLASVDWTPLLRAVIGGFALFVFYYVVRWISPRGMGGGDVKLAGLLGTVMGWFGWGSLVFGAFAAFLLGGLFGAVLLVLGRARRGTAIPFGPWMMAGAWVGIAVGEPLGRWYVGLLG
ncbi:prepilin peptidase [Microbacterium sp. NPDC089318]